MFYKTTFAKKMLIPGVLAMLSACGQSEADTTTFDFKDPKSISAISLTIDSMLEPIVGWAKGISGNVNFDPKNPLATTGKIAVDVSSVQFANEGYTATARGFALNGAKYPQIFFTLRKVLRVTRPTPNVFKASVQADFTCRGVTVPLTVPVTASYFPGKAEERTNGQYKGDILVLRANFDVSRSQYSISEGIPENLVGDKIEVRVAVVGIHYAPDQKTPVPSAQNSPAEKQLTNAPAEKQLTVAASQAAVSRPVDFKMEVERRDDPIHVAATFDLNEKTPNASFTTAEGTLQADSVTFQANKITFHLQENEQVGEATGEATFTNDSMQGFLKGKTGVLKFHGRRRLPADTVKKSLAANVKQGPGFQSLQIKQNGTTFTLAERMAFHHVPAVSIARFENFRVVEAGTFGITNVETGEPAEVNTLFQAGGMGAPLVNLLALRLAAQGKIDLNRSVNACLRKAKIPENEFTRTRPVTILDLVNGTSGLKQFKFTGYRPGSHAPTLADLLNGADPDEMEPLTVSSEPGTFNGAGINTAVLEQVIADVTGRTLPELMQEFIFAPFGMMHSAYEPLPSATASRTIALGHYSTGELMLDRVHFYPETGATGLWTTAGDFARALCQIQLLLAGKPNAVLEANQINLLKLVVTPTYVLGLRSGRKNQSIPADYFYHGGSSYGYYADHAILQQDGSGVVVMANRILSWQLTGEVTQAVAKTFAVHTTNVEKADKPLPAPLDQPVTFNTTLPEIRADHSLHTVTLSDWNRDKTRVLFFFSEQCGVTYFYKQRLQQLQKDFEGKGFAFLGIRCGHRENPDAPITLAEAGYLKMTFVDDADGSLADQFQIKQSLTFAVLDPNGKLRYRGGFDDNVTEKRVQKSYLRQALGELAAGKPVTLKVGKAIGCAIIPVHETK